MAHLFRSISHTPFDVMSVETKNTIDLMTSTFTNFAAFGDPSVVELGIEWPAISSENELLMGLNIHEKDTNVEVFPETKRMHVFAEIWDTERAESEQYIDRKR